MGEAGRVSLPCWKEELPCASSRLETHLPGSQREACAEEGEETDLRMDQRAGPGQGSWVGPGEQDTEELG